jgi:hypothetical protein
MSEVEIVTVSKEADWKTFIDLPWKIYSGDRNWVPPLKKMVRRLLDPEQHPFWRFSQGTFFLARRGTRAVGRIAAIIDNNYNEYRHEKMGSWGFFECENDPEAAHALFSSAEQWVANRGMHFLRGPLNPSTNYEVGMLIEGFEYPPAFMMTYNPRYYAALAESYGLTKEKDLWALILKDGNSGEKRPFLERVAQRIQEKGNVRIRPADISRFAEEIPLIKGIYDSAWSSNWGFVPMSDGELVEMGRNLVSIVDPDLVFFVYYNDEPVGFCLIVPDINPLLQRLNGKMGPLGFLKVRLYKNDIKGLRGLLFGFKHSHQKMGLPLVAFQHLNHLRAAKQRYEYLELGWNLEDNHDINQFEMDLGARVYKRYRVYGKPLSE